MANRLIHKVMLVEDDTAMQAVLHTLLELEGFEVLLAPSKGEQDEIIESIREAKPDAILLDVRLGAANGMDILRQLRKDGEICGSRVVMTSGMDVRDQCLEYGADSFLMKPFMPDDLIRKLRG